MERRRDSRNSLFFRSLIFVFLMLPLTSANSATWKEALKETLQATYPLTKTSKLAKERVTQPGAVFVIQQEGIMADLSSDVTMTSTKVRDGKVLQRGGASAWLAKKTTRVFKPGERVYVTDIDVEDDALWVRVLSCEMFEVTVKGSTKQTRYRGAVVFEFPKDSLATATGAEVTQRIGAVLKSEQEASAVQTKSIELGQTPEQVEAILGKPEKIIHLGQKVTYVYKDMKVIFLDGKVADVQ